MRSCTLLALLASTGLMAGGLAYAQAGGAGSLRTNSTDLAKTPDISPDQRQLRDDVFNRKRPPSKTQVVADVSGVFATLKLACTVSDARLVGKGRTEGSSQETKTYEATCDSGVGYFVVSADTDDAFSCFAAEATRDKDIAAGRAPGALCTLPANADSKVMATAILSHASIACHATKVRWIGLSAKAASEYTEVACSEGGGYVLITAAPGSSAAPLALPCLDALKRGLVCTLTKTSAPQVNIGMLTDALAAQKIACTTDQNSIRVVGQESLKKRYVVEFKCKEYPAGLVAFIPLGNSPTQFESMDCSEAKKRNVTCTLK